MPQTSASGLLDLSGLGNALGGVLGGLAGTLKGVTGSLGNTLGNTLKTVTDTLGQTLGSLLEPLQQLKLASEQGDPAAAQQYGQAVDMLRNSADQGRAEASDLLAQLGEALDEDEDQAA